MNTRRLFTVVLLLCSSTLASAVLADESDELPPLSTQGAENLYLVGKVWGYLKYHHPAVTSGCLDWDKELLARLASLRDQETKDDLLEKLDGWVAELDNFQGDSSCTRPESEVAHSSSSVWATNPKVVGQDLSRRIQDIESALTPGVGQHYVSLRPGVGNPVFQNEHDYADVDPLDWKYRILALYRFWNIVEYWSPYRHLVDSDFDQVMRDHVLKFHAADDSEDYVLALMMLTASVQDAHTNLWSAIQDRAPTGPAIAPFYVRFAEGRPIVWKELDVAPDFTISESPGSNTLGIGDVVYSIDGKPVSELIEGWAPYYGVSNSSTLLREIGRNVLRGEEGQFDLEVDRGGRRLKVVGYRINAEHVDLSTTNSHDLAGESLQILDGSIAYVKLSTITEREITRFSEHVRGSSGLIVDLRGYPRNFAVFSIGQHLVADSTPFARFTHADLSKPGTFFWTESVAIPSKEPTYDGQVVILVDETTQSQAEYTAMAFRASPNTVVIGSQTAGADGNVSHISLPGGHRTMISGIGVYYPDKSPTQKIGIVPDIEVHPTIKGIRTGTDEVLDAAVAFIRDEDE